VERFENGSDMSGFSASNRVLNLLEPVKLTVWKVMIESVTIVKFRVNMDLCIKIKRQRFSCVPLSFLRLF